MFKSEKDVIAKEVAPGIKRKILCYNDELMLCSFELEKGAILSEHHHFNLQTTYIVRGKVKFYINGEMKILEAGDNALMVADEPHRVEVLEDSKVIDVFSPMRKDFLE